MDDNQISPSVSQTPEEITATLESKKAEEKSIRKRVIVIIVSVIIVIGLVVGGAFLLMAQDVAVTAQIRDVFLIFMALESLVIGVALVILMVQLAVLINMLQNEIKPILNSTNETVNTLRGTAAFISNNLSEPIIKLNEYLAAFKRLGEIFNIGRK